MGDKDGLTFFDARSGHRLGRVAGGGSGVLSWIAPGRLLRIDGPSAFGPTTVTVMDPLRRRVLRRRVLSNDGLAGTSRLGDRQLLAVENGGKSSALVLNRDGRVVHRIELPKVFAAIIKGRLVGGFSKGSSSTARISAVDTRRKTVRQHRIPRFGSEQPLFLSSTPTRGRVVPSCAC